MNNYQVNLNYRCGHSFGAVEWNQFIEMMIDAVGFDDSMPFELVVEHQNGERHVKELSQLDLNQEVTPDKWQTIHQLLLSNHWIKGMNIKLHLVRRQDHSNLTVKCGIDDTSYREKIVRQVDDFMAIHLGHEHENRAFSQERERLFGSMLLAEPIARKTKEAFLDGAFKDVLVTSMEVLQQIIHEKLGVKIDNYYQVIPLLTQDVPYVILPDLSGNRLKQELEGLAHLIVGSLSFLHPLPKNDEQFFHEPARVLKYLVIISSIVERLENAIKNPAYTPKKVETKKVVKKPDTLKSKKESKSITKKSVQKSVLKKVKQPVKKAAKKSVKKHSEKIAKKVTKTSVLKPTKPVRKKVVKKVSGKAVKKTVKKASAKVIKKVNKKNVKKPVKKISPTRGKKNKR